MFKLWIAASYDRLGRKTTYTHDALGQIDSITDPAQQIIHFSNSACCGSGVNQLIDGNGKVTQWEKDVAGRVIRKTIDGTAVAQYAYGINTGWLRTETDAKGNEKRYDYNAEGQLSHIDYQIGNSQQTSATEDVYFSYDAFGRLESMTDPTGLTTWSYHPDGSGVGQLKEINKRLGANGAIFERLQYAYDSLGRLSERRIGLDEEVETYEYDGFGRLANLRNPLGAPNGGGEVAPFSWSYDGPGGALSQVLAPNGAKTLFTYHTGGAQLGHLQSIVHKRPGDPEQIFSSFFYEWDVVGRLRQWDQWHLPAGGSLQKRAATYGYNQADELTDAVVKNLANVETGRSKWGYDAAGNRIREQAGTALATWTVNGFNQLIERTGGGLLELRGTVDRPATVTVDGQPAEQSGLAWSRQVTAAVGENRYNVVAAELPTPPPPPPGNPHWYLPPDDPDYEMPPWLLDPDDPNYQPQPEPPPPPPPAQTARATALYTVTATPAKAMTYDANGNLINDGERTYRWDAENRLVKIIGAYGRTEFEYDGLSRRVKLTERDQSGLNTLAERRFGWEGTAISEERDASDTVKKRFWGLGETRYVTINNQPSTLKLTYTRDHLGSIREVLDETCAIRARYAYDEWGARTKVGGNLECDFGFTGHFEHAASGITLAPYRGYRNDSGRWLSVDPIEEEGGLNLYKYVDNDPVGTIDELGLQARPSSSTWNTRYQAHRARPIRTSRASMREAMRQAQIPTSRPSAPVKATYPPYYGPTNQGDSAPSRKQLICTGSDGKPRVLTRHPPDKDHPLPHWHAAPPRQTKGNPGYNLNRYGQIEYESGGPSVPYQP